MSNFGFLKDKKEYALFAAAAIEAEKVFATAPAMCAVGSRKALELGVKWVYSADFSIRMPYKDNLQSLIHEPSFRFALDSNTWAKLPTLIKVGNNAVHSEKFISAGEALLTLEILFEFIQWIDYCYGSAYEERHFDEKLIPKEKVIIDTKKIKEQESLLGEKDAEIEKLRKQIEELSATYTKTKEQNKVERTFEPEDITEFTTRKRYIDIDLKDLGWTIEGAETDVWQEYPVEDMAGVVGQKGYADYVLFGKDGLPLALIEAKRSSKDPNVGRKQAVLYADCLEKKFGRRPIMFTSNGFETYFWDDKTGPQRRVSGFFSKDDLQKLINRREERKKLDKIVINDKITDRYYQKEAIRAVCDHIEQGFRSSLLVMATGTGKTRTASSLADVLSRGGYVTNILFLADRTALVKQAKDDFKNYLPHMSLCNLCSNKDERNARIVFSTYPTMLNAIDNCKTREGVSLFTPAHFDLIIIDESHRSIFNKYRAIFEYFDALTVGLTATPKTDVDRNTYDFFEMEHGVPTYAYDYETAVEKDSVLVPYYTYEVKTKFMEEGITYAQLSQEDKERFEDDFAEDDYVPDFIPSEKLNKFVFNADTVDEVLQDLMERGIKVAGGDKLGKTIVFAQNKKHAEFIVERFNKLYPYYKGGFAQRVICDDSHAQTIIDDFKNPDKDPRIAVSVDMMDTGIDVPECLNLVFFKKVRSKTKFWQMIGRGTRLAPNILFTDKIDGEYSGKRRFLIFDYCGNFEYFKVHANGYEGKETKSLSENIFNKKIELIIAMQKSTYVEDKYQEWRVALIEECCRSIAQLDKNLVSVKLRLKYVEKYNKTNAFTCISDGDKLELSTHIAPLIVLKDGDEYAKRFDNFMYGLILADINSKTEFGSIKNVLCETALALEGRISIPQVKDKLEEIKKINTDKYWEEKDILSFEHSRRSLRDLIKFVVDNDAKSSIITNLKDVIIEEKEGATLGAAYNFEDYRKKVNRYVEDNKDALPIYKLTHNIALSKGDYEELERVLTKELGSSEDYKREYKDTPFGLLVRKIAKLEHEAAMEAFSEFINNESLNQRQIAFVNKVINHIEQNGYMEDVTDLQKPPFDKPVSVTKLFDGKTMRTLMEKIENIKENAVKTVG